MNIIQYQPGVEIIPPCYIKDLPSDIYHTHDSVSNSGLKLINRSPAHFKYPPERQETRNKVLGSALHMACLEPDLFYKTFTLLRNAKDRTTSEYKEAKKIYGEEFVLVSTECEKVEGIMNSLYSNPVAKNLLELQGNCELSGFATDPETGIVCRHRFDKLTNNGIAIDLKTTTDARHDAFSRSIFTYGYHVQSAFYSDQYEWITGERLQDFIFITVESESPYAIKVYRICDESIELGEHTYRENLNTYAYCRDVSQWPAYDSEIEEISVPKWALNRFEESLIDNMKFTEEA